MNCIITIYHMMTEDERDVIRAYLSPYIGDNNYIIEQYISELYYVFSPLLPSTLTAQGMLSNVCFDERKLITEIKLSGRVVKIGCNFGEILNPEYINNVVKKTSLRGRKKKIKVKKERKNQGTGKYFNSQATFLVKSETLPKKVYPVKIFRTGSWGVPGGLEPSMDDIRSAVNGLIPSLSIGLGIDSSDIKIVDMWSIMRNYKFRLLNIKKRADIRKLYHLFTELHRRRLHNNIPIDYSIVEYKEFDPDDIINHPEINKLVEVKYNPERYPGLIIKISTPILSNLKKVTTIKMFQSGKVNIDGTISEECAKYHYEWINRFYIKNNCSYILQT